MGKHLNIRILYFHWRRTNANGWYRVDYIFQRGKKTLHYTLSTRDQEYLGCFTSPSHIERADMIEFLAEILLEIHKVKYLSLKRTPSQAYIASSYISRIDQMCKLSRYYKTPKIEDGL